MIQCWNCCVVIAFRWRHHVYNYLNISDNKLNFVNWIEQPFQSTSNQGQCISRKAQRNATYRATRIWRKGSESETAFVAGDSPLNGDWLPLPPRKSPKMVGAFHSTKNSGNPGLGREWNRHFPEFNSEILGVPREVGLKFRKIPFHSTIPARD